MFCHSRKFHLRKCHSNYPPENIGTFLQNLYHVSNRTQLLTRKDRFFIANVATSPSKVNYPPEKIGNFMAEYCLPMSMYHVVFVRFVVSWNHPFSLCVSLLSPALCCCAQLHSIWKLWSFDHTMEEEVKGLLEIVNKLQSALWADPLRASATKQVNFLCFLGTQLSVPGWMHQRSVVFPGLQSWIACFLPDLLPLFWRDYVPCSAGAT